MKVFYIIDERFDTKMDKATFIEIYRELNRSGIDTKILTSFDKEKYMDKNKEFYPEYFSSVNIPFLFRVLFCLKVFFYVLKNAEKNDFLIVTSSVLPFFVILRYMKGVKIHLDFRTLPVVLKNSLKEKIDSYLSVYLSTRFFARLADTTSFITKDMRLEVEKLYNFSPKSYCYWSSGVSLDNFNMIKKAGTGKNEIFTYFYHGTVTGTRGLDLLYNAYKIILRKGYKKTKLLIVGDGPYFKELKRTVEEDNLIENVELTGFVDYSKISDYINMSDVCVSPLPNYIEWNVSSPIKIFEYMAMEKPIICTNIPAHQNVLKDKPFAVFADDNPQSIADAMIYSYKFFDKLNSFSKEERDFVIQNYTWEKQARILGNYLISFVNQDDLRKTD